MDWCAAAAFLGASSTTTTVTLLKGKSPHLRGFLRLRAVNVAVEVGLGVSVAVAVGVSLSMAVTVGVSDAVTDASTASVGRGAMFFSGEWYR